VLGYYGVDVREATLMGPLHSLPKEGTRPEAIERVARSYGLQAELRQHVKLEDLQKELDQGRPVIVDAQAWRTGAELKLPWSKVWESGHYMVAIGMDADNLYLEDPSLLGSRGFTPRREFLERWHDYETGPHKSRQEYLQAAIFLRGREPKPPATLVPVR
jgi:predicted double-glycine peptidase